MSLNHYSSIHQFFDSWYHTWNQHYLNKGLPVLLTALLLPVPGALSGYNITADLFASTESITEWVF